MEDNKAVKIIKERILRERALQEIWRRYAATEEGDTLDTNIALLQFQRGIDVLTDVLEQVTQA